MYHNVNYILHLMMGRHLLQIILMWIIIYNLKVIKYYAHTTSGDYFCKICMERTPPNEVIVEKDKTGSTI